MTWPKDWAVSLAYLPSIDTFRLRGSGQNSALTVQVTRSHPPTYANRYSVSRVWQENITNAEQLEGTKQDLGCEGLAKTFFRCSRDAKGSTRKTVAEALYWNRNQDLILVRVTSEDPARTAKALLGSLKMSVLPSGESTAR